MKVGIFLKTTDRPYNEDTLRSFAKAIEKFGEEVFIHDELAYKPCDVAVIFGSWKISEHPHHILKRLIVEEKKKEGKPVIVFETPLVGRKIQDQHEYLRVGINHFLQDEANFVNENSPGDRWKNITKELNVEVSPWRSTGKHVLIVLQSVSDASLRNLDMGNWGPLMVKKVRQYTNREILVRPHPSKNKYKKSLMMRNIRNAGRAEMADITTQTLKDNLKNCWCTITYTSGVAVDSVIAGIPTIAYDSGNMAWPISSHKLSEIEDPKMPDRTQWFNNMGYVQWSMEEIEQGLPWLHLKKGF